MCPGDRQAPSNAAARALPSRGERVATGEPWVRHGQDVAGQRAPARPRTGRQPLTPPPLADVDVDAYREVLAEERLAPEGRERLQLPRAARPSGAARARVVPMAGDPSFDAAAVAAICRHMNEDHREDAVLICRHLGGVDDVVAAETVGVDAAGLAFQVRRSGGAVVLVAVPFAAPVAGRPEVRAAVVELYERACAAAGLAPRGH